MKSGIKLKLIRYISKFLLKIGKKFILSSSLVQVSRKIADLALKNTIPDNEVFEIQGFKMKIGKATRYLLLAEDYEPSTTKLINKEVKNGMRVFDLGANIGWFTLVFSKLVGDSGIVYSFEPDPYYFHILKENIKLNKLKNVLIFQLAASNKLGMSSFNLNKTFGTYVLNSNTISENSQNVKTTTIDKFCQEHNTKIDFIKMDVEGSEPKTLEGMKKVIAANPNLRIISEFHPDAITDVGSSPENYLRNIEQAGFRIHKISEKHLGKIEPATKNELLKIHGIAGSANLYCFKELKNN